jgi:hypothetical protein
MLFKLERSIYDILEETLGTVIRDAVTTDTRHILDRRLPIISVSDNLEDDKLMEVAYDTTNKFMYEPTCIKINKELARQIQDDELTQVFKEVLHYEDAVIDENNLTIDSADKFTLLNVEDTEPELDVTIDYVEGVIEDFEEDDENILVANGELEELAEIIDAEEKAVEEELTKTIDDYELVLVKKDDDAKSKVPEGVKRYHLPDSVSETMVNTAEEVADIIEPSLRGKGLSRRSSYVPDKRLHTRNVMIDYDKEFIHKSVGEGKSNNIVIVLDRSGSMGGKPANDSSVFVEAINSLVHKYPKLKCSVVYSDDDDAAIVHLPVAKTSKGISTLLEMNGTHCAEGLAENMDRYIKRIREAEYVFVYTDGDIVSAPVDKSKYTAWGVELIGLYTANVDMSKPEEYERHYDKNKTWFHKVIVSNKITDLAEHVAGYLGE